MPLLSYKILNPELKRTPEAKKMGREELETYGTDVFAGNQSCDRLRLGSSRVGHNYVDRTKCQCHRYRASLHCSLRWAP